MKRKTFFKSIFSILIGIITGKSFLELNQKEKEPKKIDFIFDEAISDPNDPKSIILKGRVEYPKEIILSFKK